MAEQAVEAARTAHLRYTTDARSGIGRERDGDSFSYRRPDGTPVTDEQELARIVHLAIPAEARDGLQAAEAEVLALLRGLMIGTEEKVGAA